MSTATVTHDTLALAAAENLSIAQLPTWYDVDTVAELDRLRVQLSLHQNGQAIHTRKFLTLPSPFGRGARGEGGEGGKA
ncbi:MAG: hypothetical protein HY260_08895 [Chloroflexi bacterium]|nr:hypothetical protein [Chloroflexota bacterium]